MATENPQLKELNQFFKNHTNQSESSVPIDLTHLNELDQLNKASDCTLNHNNEPHTQLKLK